MDKFSIKALSTTVDQFKAKFATHIADKSIPLNERWETFTQAPDYLKNHERFVQRFEALDEDAIMYSGWLIDTERHQVVTAQDIDYAILEHDKYWADGEWQTMTEEGRRIYDDVREEILQKNLGSFEYDW